jgi:hypothetical protein
MLVAWVFIARTCRELPAISNLKRPNPEAGTPRHFRRLASEIELPALWQFMNMPRVGMHPAYVCGARCDPALPMNFPVTAQIALLIAKPACKAAENANRAVVRRKCAAAADSFESKPASRRISSADRAASRPAKIIFSDNQQPTYCHVF